jgi:hypothetical protein
MKSHGSEYFQLSQQSELRQREMEPNSGAETQLFKDQTDAIRPQRVEAVQYAVSVLSALRDRVERERGRIESHALQLASANQLYFDIKALITDQFKRNGYAAPLLCSLREWKPQLNRQAGPLSCDEDKRTEQLIHLSGTLQDAQTLCTSIAKTFEDMKRNLKLRLDILKQSVD